MAEFRIELSATAERQLRKLDTQGRRRVVERIRDLGRDPHPVGCRKLRGYDDVWRVRVGVFRIIYSVEDDRLLVIVLQVGHRRAVYR